jgi:hypothetical protein
VSNLLPAVVIGGVTYYLVRRESMPIPVGCPVGASPNRGTPLTQIGGCPPVLDGYSYDPYLYDGGQAGFAQRPLDPYVSTKADMVQDQLERAYNALDGVGRAAAAAKMNEELHLDPPLRGDETWETVARVAGGAAGAAGCAVVGLGAVGPLCAMVGSYLGVKLEDWIADQNVGDWVKGTVEDLGGWINNLF